MPIFKNNQAVEFGRNVRLFLNVEAGLTGAGAMAARLRSRLRGEEPPAPVARSQAVPAQTERPAGGNQKLKQAQQQIGEKDREIARLRAELSESDAAGIKPESIVWIFCTGRSGSTWLASMMDEVEGHAMWNEPLVGALFGEFYYVRAAHKTGPKGILGEPYRDVWLRSIRSFVMEGSAARYPGVSESGYLVIKEPHGSIGAPLLAEALPESRMIFLVRDPRDVVSSALDGQRKGSWTFEHRGGGKKVTKADTDPDAFVKSRAEIYSRDIGNSREAYEAHGGPKALVRYEDLLADTLGTMKRLYSDLGIEVSEKELQTAVEKHSWENIPEEKKGEGKFYRKGSSGGWREDLTEEQARIVEETTAPLLEEFYPEREKR